MLQNRELAPLLLLSALFAAALVTANVISGKIVAVGPLFVPAGVLAYSITFAVTDTVCEIWGVERARILVRSGFAVLVLVWLLMALALYMPAAPFWQGQAAFSEVLGSTNRIIIASMVAYGVSQSLDVWVFNRLKAITSARHLWIRNNVSTLISQSVDTVLFITIAFYGELPLLPLMGGQLAVKYAIALLDTPMVYGMVYLVRTRMGPLAPQA